MHDSFDPYRKWLGIRAAERPLNHYQLLGLEPFEDDAETISNAVDQRTAFVRTLAISQHAEITQRVLNELAAARVCLLNPDKKAAYDERLCVELAPPPSFSKVSAQPGFDPYYRWLGIPPAEQPPHHYQLLGLATFESDADVIEQAVNRQMAHVRNFQAGPHSAVSQRLLNELSTAKLSLLDPARKRRYDDALRTQLRPAAPPSVASQPPKPPPDLVAPPAAQQSIAWSTLTKASAVRTHFARSQRRPSWFVPLAAFLAAATLVPTLAFLIFGNGGNDSEPARKRVAHPKIDSDQPPPWPEKPAPIAGDAKEVADSNRPGVDDQPKRHPAPENLAPSVQIVSVEPETPEAGGSLTIRLTGRDPEGDPVTLEYRSNSNENWQPASDLRLTIPDLRTGLMRASRPMPVASDHRLTIPDLKSGRLTLYVRAHDSAGNPSEVVTRTLEVKPAVPHQPPPLAMAPFSADQAKRHQEAWAKHLKRAIAETNSISMKLILVPPGEFQLGSPPSEVGREDDELQHRVRITNPLYMGILEVTQKEYQDVMGNNPSWFSSGGDGKELVRGRDTHQFPVENVSWDDAVEFCRRLSASPAEQSVGRVYRLPTEAEWEYACRAGTSTPFHFGDMLNGQEANCNSLLPYGTSVKGPSLGRPVEVRSYAPNPLGLHDMHGNVNEWCLDWYGAYGESADGSVNPVGIETGPYRVNRGGGWGSDAAYCRSTFRGRNQPTARSGHLGFRVALVPSSRASEAATTGSGNLPAIEQRPVEVQPPGPPFAKAPFSAEQANRHQNAWASHLKSKLEESNSIGMKLVLIPPGEFRMGSPPSEVGRRDNELQHRVRITKPFYMGMHEVTQREYNAVMGKSPSFFSTGGGGKANVGRTSTNQFPVENVSWHDAVEFCRRLSALPAEQSVGRVYRLPTEAEWEYACRAGTTATFHFGDKLNGKEANCDGQSPYGTNVKGPILNRTAKVGSYPPNPFGLRDMHGNVWEWCVDWHAAYGESVDGAVDPVGAETGSNRVNRGGGWHNVAVDCRAAYRDTIQPEFRNYYLGFRVALVPYSPASETASAGSGDPSAIEQRPVDLGPAGPPSTVGPYTAKGLHGRGDAMRQQVAARRGASARSELAVGKALRWLIEHQYPDGGWSFDHRGAGKCVNRCSGAGTLKDARLAATGLALLPFLGQGQTHKQGKYKDVVRRGLMYLCENMKVTANGGDMTGGGGAMYGHGICSIALCEAYAMTQDRFFKKPAQAALNFIMYAQDPTGGGWRYSPRTQGDTSVAGWQIMALKDGDLGNLQVLPATIKGAEKFLDFVQTDDGAAYGYDRPGSGAATNAVGLLCRMYMGWTHDDPRLGRGVKALAALGPQAGNMYFNYYATQLLCQYEGPLWEDQWNPKMRDMLVESQSAADGHENGSWAFKGDPGGDTGGRLYSTAMAAMTLEVYYRYMPLYSK